MKAADKPTAAELIRLTLTGSKLQTITGIYKRLQGGADGRIRTKLAPYTETGRLRSGEDDWWPEPTTNLQNLPKKVAALDPLYEVRNVIVPAAGSVFIEGDLSQAESLTTAAYAGDWAKVGRILEGDEHSELAARIFNIPVEQVDRKKQRPIGKIANHGLNYGAGWKTFMENVNKDADITGVTIDAKMAKKVIAAWQEMNPKTVRWWQEVKQEAASKGFLTNAFGRKRIFLSQGSAGNDVIAYLPQSTIADLLNASLVRLFGLEAEHGFRIVLQIHDAILVEAPLAKWRTVARIMHQTMLMPMEINGRSLTVPVDVSMSGKSWGKMKEIKE